MVALLSLSKAEDDAAYEDQVDRDLMEGGEQCLQTRSISRSGVMHDQAIIFNMRGGEMYVNVLPKPCKRLAKAGRFMYETAASRLCRGDLIKILVDRGFGMETGRTCRLGGFHPITQDQIDRLTEPKTVDPQPVPPADPERPEVAAPEDSS